MNNKIDNDHYYSIFNELKVIINNKTGFISAKSILGETGKQFCDWARYKNSKNLIIKFLINKLLIKSNITYDKIPKNIIEKAFYTVLGNQYSENKDILGAYLHPDLVLDLINWRNKSLNETVEINYQALLHNYLSKINENPVSEYKINIGRIDILSDNYLCEVKNYKNWTNAIGQIMNYGLDFPNHKLVLYIFDANDQDTKRLEEICKKTNIQVIYNPEQLI